jgi:uncharacterized alpha-E superfamily protein
MLSRSAEKLYWLARYVERTENTARLISVYTNLMYDLPIGVEIGWRNLLNICGAEAVFFERFKTPGEQNTTRFLMTDTGNPGSLFSSLSYARENIRTTRDLMPDEAWQMVNEMYLYAKDHLDLVSSRRGRVLFLQEILTGCQRFSGFLSGSMSRDAPYRFITLGRNIERADMTTRILDIGSVLLAEERSDRMRRYESALWINVLKALSALLMYRKKVRHRIKGGDVLDYMLKDPDLPRAVSHCIDELMSSIRKLPHSEDLIGHLTALGDYVLSLDMQGISPQQLHSLLDSIQSRLGVAHQQIAAAWFLNDETSVAQTQLSV